jgi:phospholipase/carboxylesterase
MKPHFSDENWSDRLKADLPDMPDGSRFGDAWSDDDILLEDLVKQCSPFSDSGLVELSKDLTIYLPENYEPNYPYPLILWLNGWEHTQQELLGLMPKLSDRNYMGTSVCGHGVGDRFSVNVGPEPLTDTVLELIESRICETVAEIRSEYNLHTERVLLAGVGHQGTRAMQLLLRHPDWYGGAAVFGGRFPSLQPSSDDCEDYQGKPVLVGMRTADLRFPTARTVDAARELHSAGMNVAVRVYDVGDEITPKMLADMNHWIASTVCESSYV